MESKSEAAGRVSGRELISEFIHDFTFNDAGLVSAFANLRIRLPK